MIQKLVNSVLMPSISFNGAKTPLKQEKPQESNYRAACEDLKNTMRQNTGWVKKLTQQEV